MPQTIFCSPSGVMITVWKEVLFYELRSGKGKQGRKLTPKLKSIISPSLFFSVVTAALSNTDFEYRVKNHTHFVFRLDSSHKGQHKNDLFRRRSVSSGDNSRSRGQMHSLPPYQRPQGAANGTVRESQTFVQAEQSPLCR